MADLDALLDLIPIDDIAKQLGIPEGVAEDAVKAVVPAIIGGMAANSKDSGGAKSLEGALAKHGTKVPKGRPKVAQIDAADGEKIVSNVFGGKKEAVVVAVASSNAAGDATKEIIAKVLPIVAPIVIAWIASEFLGQKPAAAPAPTPEPAAAPSSGGIGDLLGGLLSSPQGQDILGGVLGGLLGAGKK
jgi:hypothetical protein